MLNTLRSKRKAILWVLVVVGVIAFVFFGVGGRAAAGAQDSTVAKVNGEKIDYKEFSSMFERTFQQQLKMYEQYTGYVNDKMKEQLRNRVQKRVINNLVDRKLLLQKAREIGFYVSVNEIKNNLKQYSAFQTDGEFDESKWNQWIQNTPDESLSRVEKSIKEDILIQKMVEFLSSNVSVNSEEVNDYYLKQNQKIRFDYAVANINEYMEKIDVTDEDLKKYYEEQKESYRVPEKVDVKFIRINPFNIKDNYDIPTEEAKAYFDENKKDYQRGKEVKVQYVKINARQYFDRVNATQNEIYNYYQNNKKQFVIGKRVALDAVTLNAEDFYDQIDVSDSEVKNYYKDNKEDYKIKAKARAKHILFRWDTEDEKKEKYKKAKEVLKKIESGEDFSEMAETYSDGPSSNRGGDLGYFSRGEMVEKFEDVVFNQLEKNQVSDIVETRFGYHIIKLIDKEDARYADLEDKSVYNSVVEKVKNRKAKTILKEKQERISDFISTSGNLKNLAENMNADFERTSYLTEDDFAKKYGKNRELLNSIFSLKENEVSNPYIVDNQLYVFKLINLQKNYTKSLSNPDVREKVVQEVKKQKALEMAKEKARNYYEKLDVAGVENFEETVKQMGAKVYPTDFFEAKRNEFVPGIGRNFNFIKAAFGLDYSSISNPVKINDGYVIMRLLNSRVGYIPTYNEVAGQVKEDLKVQKATKNIEKIAKKVRKKIEKEGFENDLVEKYNIKPVSQNDVTEDSLNKIVRVRRKKDLEKFRENIFNLEKNKISDPVWMEKTAYIFKVNDKKESYIKPFAQIKSDLLEKYKKEKAKNMAMKNIKDETMMSEGPIEISDKASDTFNKTQLQKIADSLQQGNKIIEEGSRIYYIENIEIDKSVYKKLKEDKYQQIKKRLLNEKSNNYVQKWLSNVRDESSIRIYLN